MESTVKSWHIFTKLVVLGVVAVGMILGSVFWLTARLDRLEQEKAEDLVSLMITETVSRVRAMTADYAHWDLAYDIVTRGDEDAILEHLGTGATDSTLFDRLVILSTDHEVLHVYDAAGMPAFDVADVEPFLALLAQEPPTSYASVEGIARLGQGFGAVSAAWITPDDPRTAESARLPIMLGIVMFSGETLAAIGRLTQGTGYAIREVSASGDPLGATAREPHVALVGPSGTPVAQLVWSPRNIGTVLRQEIMPGLILVSLGIFGICLSAARYFHMQSRTLERAHRLASTDQLTGLLNRSGLDALLQAGSLVRMIAAGHGAVIYLDLNDFKTLNDQLGHKAGDRALKVTAQRLEAAVRESDHVVRLGGDEFICIVLDADPAAAADRVAERIADACWQPIDFGGEQRLLRPSMGIAIAEPGLTWDALLARSDTAMYAAKRGKSDGPVFYSPAGDAAPEPSPARVARRPSQAA